MNAFHGRLKQRVNGFAADVMFRLSNLATVNCDEAATPRERPTGEVV